MSSLVELRPNQGLLDNEFEGYKLNLKALPYFYYKLPSSVDRVYPDEVQYSFIHAKLFAFHNHLVVDYWNNAFNYYYLDENLSVRHVTFEHNQTFQNNIVYNVQIQEQRKSGHFNLCLLFPSKNLAVISDGTGYLHIVDTKHRHHLSSETWKNEHSCSPLGENKYFVLIDTRIEEKDKSEVLHCALLSVEQNEEHFNSVITWVSFQRNNEIWEQFGFKQIQGKGIVHYAAIESNCTAMYIASDNPFKFTTDSDNEIVKKTKQERKIIYTWLQTTEDITVTLKLEPNFDKNLLHITVTPSTIKINYAGSEFVDGKLKYKVDSKLTTWNIQEDGEVHVLLTKKESMIWDDFLEKKDPKGEQILDPSLVAEAHQRLAHLCSETEVLTPDQSVPGLSTQQLEECDAPSEEDTVLVRMDAQNHKISHRIPLCVHQFIFSIKLNQQTVPALALRHDVDACIWQPFDHPISSDNWPVKHQGTLMAFGYIQSSKQNRKFVTCSPNFSYSVVCESLRHIFIYKNTGNQNQLRRRSGGNIKRVKVGQQYIFNIDQYGEVLGINATNEYLFILTKTSLIAIQIE